MQCSAFKAPNGNLQNLNLDPPRFHTATFGIVRIPHLYQLNVKDDVQHETGSQTDANGHFRPKAPVPLLAKRYRFVKVLGEGVSAILIEAEDIFQQSSNSMVAIKVLHTQYFPIGYQEVDNLQQMNREDPYNTSHIVKLLNVFTFDKHFCIVTELLNCKLLTQVFTRWKDDNKRLSMVRKVAVQMLQAMGLLRQVNIIHTDIKPENILAVKDLKIHGIKTKLIDFGNAIHCVDREMSVFHDDFDLTTLMYRSPELFLGEPLFIGETRGEMVSDMYSLLGPISQKQVETGKFFPELQQYVDSTPSLPNTVFQRMMQKLWPNPGDRQADAHFVTFLLSLLQYDPETRMTPWEAFQHPFIAPEINVGFLIPVQPGRVQQNVAEKEYCQNVSPFVSDDVRRHNLSSVQLLRRGTKCNVIKPTTVCAMISQTHDQIKSDHNKHLQRKYQDVKVLSQLKITESKKEMSANDWKFTTMTSNESLSANTANDYVNLNENREILHQQTTTAKTVNSAVTYPMEIMNINSYLPVPRNINCINQMFGTEQTIKNGLGSKNCAQTNCKIKRDKKSIRSCISDDNEQTFREVDLQMEKERSGIHNIHDFSNRKYNHKLKNSQRKEYYDNGSSQHSIDCVNSSTKNSVIFENEKSDMMMESMHEISSLNSYACGVHRQSDFRPSKELACNEDLQDTAYDTRRTKAVEGRNTEKHLHSCKAKGEIQHFKQCTHMQEGGQQQNRRCSNFENCHETCITECEETIKLQESQSYIVNKNSRIINDFEQQKCPNRQCALGTTKSSSKRLKQMRYKNDSCEDKAKWNIQWSLMKSKPGTGFKRKQSRNGTGNRTVHPPEKQNCKERRGRKVKALSTPADAKYSGIQDEKRGAPGMKFESDQEDSDGQSCESGGSGPIIRPKLKLQYDISYDNPANKGGTELKGLDCNRYSRPPDREITGIPHRWQSLSIKGRHQDCKPGQVRSDRQTVKRKRENNNEQSDCICNVRKKRRLVGNIKAGNTNDNEDVNCVGLDNGMLIKVVTQNINSEQCDFKLQCNQEDDLSDIVLL
ncbi:uncharacterized protein [Ptychodera flava]|uniref:uncharacterized protein isoform X3 n=1 Tax=Ptychodera flava TaxID=63121 RepID=UPI00396A146E